MSAAARPSYGIPEVVSERRSGELVNVIALLTLVVGLAVAAVWFVALPALDEPPPGRSCEVVVQRSGATRCIPTGRALPAAKRDELTKRPTR